jgi:DNA-binding CsgD family transcriptional regulator
MAASTARGLRDDLVRLAHRGTGVREFSLAAARRVARAVPFDGVCVLTLDPATLLPTGEVVEHGLPPAAIARMTEIELRGQDVNSFGALARSQPRAATLSQATDGDLNRSLRHRELRGPCGFGDELRAALTDGATTWGALTLLRQDDQRPFTPADAGLIASVAGDLAEGLRRAMLLGARPAVPPRETAAGFALLAADNTVTMADAVAERWLAELDGSGSAAGLPPAVTAVARQARLNATSDAPAAIARARVRTASGRWLLIRGSVLDDRPDAPTAMSIELARAHELAPLIVAAYGLSDRERAVTQLVAQGYATAAIGDRLHLSPWTVQDHLKAIFEKVGVSTRGELVARLFFDHYAPQLTDYDG